MMVATQPRLSIDPRQRRRFAPARLAGFGVRGDRGMGATTGQQYVAAGASLATSGLAVASSTGALAPLAASLSVSVPVLGAIIGVGIMAAAEAITLIMNSGCGQTCIVSTQFANQANAALQQNIEAYFALPTPRKRTAQLAALQNFDSLWQWLQAPGQCGNPALQDAGRRCITDRQAGACTWRQPASSVPPWGSPPAGACWNWVSGYRDPIAADTNVYDDTVTLASAGSDLSTAAASVFGSVQSLPAWALPALALLILAVAL